MQYSGVLTQSVLCGITIHTTLGIGHTMPGERSAHSYSGIGAAAIGDGQRESYCIGTKTIGKGVRINAAGGIGLTIAVPGKCVTGRGGCINSGTVSDG